MPERVIIADLNYDETMALLITEVTAAARAHRIAEYGPEEDDLTSQHDAERALNRAMHNIGLLLARLSALGGHRRVAPLLDELARAILATLSYDLTHGNGDRDRILDNIAATARVKSDDIVTRSAT